MEICGRHGLHVSRRNLLVLYGLSAPCGFALLLFPTVQLAEAAVIVMAQTSEVVEANHLQIRPGQSVRELLADGVKDSHPRLFLDALGKSFLFAMCLFLRRRLIAGNAVVNVAFIGLAEIEDAASTLAVNKNGGSRVGAFCFCLGGCSKRDGLRFRKY